MPPQQQQVPVDVIVFQEMLDIFLAERDIQRRLVELDCVSSRGNFSGR